MTGFTWLPSMLPLTSPGPSTSDAGRLKPYMAKDVECASEIIKHNFAVQAQNDHHFGTSNVYKYRQY